MSLFSDKMPVFSKKIDKMLQITDLELFFNLNFV